MTILVITRDLMDASRFRAANPEVEVAARVDSDVARAATLVIVDLAGNPDLGGLVALGTPVIAYGAHVDTDALAEARAVGCIDAVARSRIFRRVAELAD